MWDDELILPTNRVPTSDEFLRALRVAPTGFGAQILLGVYRQFFVWSTDLRDQYERYYCVEYPTLSSYLESAHEICLAATDLEKKYILQIKSPSGVVDEAYDRNALDVVLECIRSLEGPHED